MTLDRWDDTAKVTYDPAVWNELCSLRFVDGGHNAVIMGPVGVGKTFLATALGHAAAAGGASGGLIAERRSGTSYSSPVPQPLTGG